MTNQATTGKLGASLNDLNLDIWIWSCKLCICKCRTYGSVKGQHKNISILNKATWRGGFSSGFSGFRVSHGTWQFVRESVAKAAIHN